MADAHDSRPQQTADQGATIVTLAARLQTETTGRNGEPPGLDAALDRDLGFDSLTRMEFYTRVERACGVTLTDQALASVETLRDLLRLVGRSEVAARPPTETLSKHFPEEAADTETPAIPTNAATLTDVLLWHGRRHPQRTHILLLEENQAITYGSLLDGGLRLAAGLRAAGLTAGEAVALMLPTGRSYFESYCGTLLAGCVPVPLYPPVRTAQIGEHFRRHRHILANARARLLITIPEAKNFARLLKAQTSGLDRVATPEELQTLPPMAQPVPAWPQDTALLQYTSGSTGNPKGVILSHLNLLANIRAMGAASGVTPADVFVSWLPLYHDMGLIGAWLGSLYFGFRLALLSPFAFLRRPVRWLKAIDEQRATLTAAPNFGYELCCRKIGDDELAGLDLSSLRHAFNGAEPVRPATIALFAERFASHGFSPRAMTPVYGLAESSVGLSFPPMDRGPLVDRIDRLRFQQTGEAQPAAASCADPLLVPSCGRPLAGHQVRVVDSRDRELPERHEGHLQFRGPSATSGYLRSQEQTAALFHGDWLDSGDLAYMAGDEIFVTGRVKDLIIRAGRNIPPHELEETVSEVDGVRRGCVAVFGTPDALGGTERLVVVAESRETNPERRKQIQSAVHQAVTDAIGAPADEVRIVAPHTVPKTSSGKIRRAACRKAYEDNTLERPGRAPWLQLARLALAGIAPGLKRRRREAAALLYNVACWTLFYLLAPPTWILVMLLPTASLRWRAARTTARLLVRLSGTPLLVRGLEHLPRGRPLVVVANHQSYLDAIVLAAALPLEGSYVAKAELADRFFTRTALSRLGVQFVDRFENARGPVEVERLARLASTSFFFFPEGTFRRMPGLLPFYMGAFMVAARAGLEVVPVAIRGTRSMLRSGSWFMRRGTVQVTVCPPITPEGNDWPAALSLRQATRNAIVTLCGEPDLTAFDPPHPT